jgi:membrane protein YdbS with pleckstrin-like domain
MAVNRRVGSWRGPPLVRSSDARSRWGTIPDMVTSELELMPGEKMILSAHPHWFFFWKQVAAGIGILALLLLMSAVNVDWIDSVIGWVAALAFVVWVVNTIYQFVQWRTTRFAVTDQRVAYQSGVVRRRGVSIPLNRINNVNFEQSLIARMLNNGTVTIESAGETGDSVFENIPDPENARTVIFNQMQADEQADSQRDAAAIADALRGEPLPAPTGTPVPPSAEDRLAELEGLHRRGLVSDEEFEAKRKQIVNDI